MRRIAAFGAVAALVATTLLSPSGISVAGATHDTATGARPGEVPTRFAFEARGLGTKVVGGDLPAGSGATATRTIGCTNMAGRVAENFIAEAEIPGLGTAEGVRTKVWTSKHGDTVASNAKQTIAGINLIDTDVLSLDVTALESRSRAWHDDEGYHATASAKVLGLTLTLPGQEPQELAVPTPGNPVVVPGLVKIALGTPKKTVNDRSAYTSINALDIQILATGSRVKAGHSRARIAEGIVGGIFKGYSAGLTADILEPVLELGKTPLHVIPCEGTAGQVTTKAASDDSLPGVLDLGAIEVQQFGDQVKGLARGFEDSMITDLSLLDGAVKIKAVHARAIVRREAGELTRRSVSTVGSINIQGEEYPIPIDQPIEVPGLVTIEPGYVKELPSGLHVVALRVTALDGQLADIDLGIARLQIRKP